ncbi:MAG: hypothetical protein ACTHWA_00265 [Arachnia sp.]
MEQKSTQQNQHGSDVESAGSQAQQQSQEEQRIQTEERLSMDSSDMGEAIDQEKDSKFDGANDSRYADEAEETLQDGAH